MKKKTLSLVLVTLLSVSVLAGCGSKKEDPESTPTPTVEVTEPTEEPTVEPTEEPTTEPTEAPSAEPTTAYSTDEIEAAGSVDGVTYTNTKIGFTASAPESWLVYGADEAYDVVAQSAGTDAASLKSQITTQGIAYIFYGCDTQISPVGGVDNILVQTMNSTLFGGLGIEDVIDSLSAVVINQYKTMGATCTATDPEKIDIDGQDVYRVSVVAELTSGETTTAINQEYVIFEKNGSLVYMALTTGSDDSAAMAQAIVDSLSFQ